MFLFQGIEKVVKDLQDKLRRAKQDNKELLIRIKTLEADIKKGGTDLEVIIHSCQSHYITGSASDLEASADAIKIPGSSQALVDD